jgi:hypothetical protein
MGRISGIHHGLIVYRQVYCMSAAKKLEPLRHQAWRGGVLNADRSLQRTVRELENLNMFHEGFPSSMAMRLLRWRGNLNRPRGDSKKCSATFCKGAPRPALR